MKLYNYFRSSASYRVRIALALKGLDYEYISVHLAKGEHKLQPYQNLVADGLVPMLQDGENQLSQSLAIMEYLDEKFPQNPLLPADLKQRAIIRSLALSIACEIHPLNNLRVLKYLSAELKQSEDQKNQWYRHWVREGLESFERQLNTLSVSTYCVGETPSLADCCLVPQIFNAKRFDCDLSGLPRTMAVFEACMKHSAFETTQPSKCPDFQA